MGTILHAVIGYVFLTLVVRVLQRRPGAQMTLAEFVLVFLLGGVIILATVGQDRSVTNCTCGVIAVAMMHRTISFLETRFPRFGAWMDGTPLLLVRKGEWQRQVMRRMNLAEEDVMAAARLHDIREFKEIEYAVLERNGGISVIRRKEQTSG